VVRHFATPTTARGKGEHQDSPVAQSREVPAGTDRKQLAQNIADDLIGALAASRPG